MKRVWIEAKAVPEGAVWKIELDGKPLRIPGAGTPLRMANPALAQAVAAEWHGAGDTLTMDDLPLTRLAGTAQDRIAPDPAPVAAASSRCPERKSAWKWVSITRSIRSWSRRCARKPGWPRCQVVALGHEVARAEQVHRVAGAAIEALDHLAEFVRIELLGKRRVTHDVRKQGNRALEAFVVLRPIAMGRPALLQLA